MRDKRRGLGRGLGALIPTSPEGARPVDVFFPASSGVDSTQESAIATIERPAPDGVDEASLSGVTNERPADGSPADAEEPAAPESTDAEKSGSDAAAPAEREDDTARGGDENSQNSNAAGGVDQADVAEPGLGGRESSGEQAPASSGERAGERVAASSGQQAEEFDASTDVASGSKGISTEASESTDDRAGVSRETSTAPSSGDDLPGQDGTDPVDASEGVGGERAASRDGSDGGDESDGGDVTDVSGVAEASAAQVDESSVSGYRAEPHAPVDAHAVDAHAADGIRSANASRDGDDADLVPVPGATFAELPVSAIRPNARQPRTVFDEGELDELIESIKEIGILQPIVVRPDPSEQGQYELIMGERRWRASQAAGLETVPAIIRVTDDEAMLRDALLENLHRSALNPLEEAAAYRQLLDDFGCTHDELAARIARSRPQISNTLRLLRLPPLVQRRLAAGVLSAGHARALLGLSDGAAIERLAQRIVSEGLSVRATEEIVALGGLEDKPRNVRPRAGQRSEAIDALAGRLSDRFETRVRVDLGKSKGRVTIEFASVEDLNRILDVMAPSDPGLLRA